jgi:predicted transcriptional regulator
LLQTLIDDFVQRALGGSVSPFLAYLVHDARLTDEELDELKRIVRELEKDNRKP